MDVEELKSGDITMQFFRPILLQLLDQGILENIERFYKKQLLRTVLEVTDETDMIT